MATAIKYTLNRYVLADIVKLEKDVEKNFKTGKANNPDGKRTYLSLIEYNGMCGSTFNNAKRNYAVENNKALFDSIYDTGDRIEYTIGAIQKSIYILLLNIFNLEDVYRIPFKEDKPETDNEPIDDNNTEHNDEIVAKLDEILVTLNKLVDLWTPTNKPTPAKPVASLRS